MKKIVTFLSILSLFSCSAYAQCASGATTYDLTVSGNVVLGPTGTPYTYGIVCSTGHLMDSASCCTRLIHIESGGIYEAGPMAYGIVWVKSGGTFDAHGNTSFFSVNYEAGATILNYTGTLSLCPAITFAPGTCLTTSLGENSVNSYSIVYPNPANANLHLENNFSKNSILTVYDIAGKKLMDFSNFTNDIDISILSEGMYTFTISVDGNKVSYGKFAVVR